MYIKLKHFKSSKNVEESEEATNKERAERKRSTHTHTRRIRMLYHEGAHAHANVIRRY